MAASAGIRRRLRRRRLRRWLLLEVVCRAGRRQAARARLLRLLRRLRHDGLRQRGHRRRRLSNGGLRRLRHWLLYDLGLLGWRPRRRLPLLLVVYGLRGLWLLWRRLWLLRRWLLLLLRRLLLRRRPWLACLLLHRHRLQICRR